MPTISEYRAMLKISKHRLDDELEIQADFQERISAEVARLNTRMLNAKDELARVEARLTQQFKDDAEKITVAEIGAKVIRSAERMRAFDEFQGARQDHEEWSGLLSAWINRGRSIKGLGELYIGQYFSVRSVGRREPPPRPQERAAERAMQSVRDAGAASQRRERRALT